MTPEINQCYRNVYKKINITIKDKESLQLKSLVIVRAQENALARKSIIKLDKEPYNCLLTFQQA